MPKSVLVVPGAGKQGQAAIRAFLQRGFTVHTFSNTSSDAAQKLLSMGAELHTGDLGDVGTIENALNNVECLFFAIPANPQNEVSFAKNVIEAAQNKGVKSVVYTSVARTGEHTSFPGWNDDYPLGWYWKNKQAIEDRAYSGWNTGPFCAPHSSLRTSAVQTLIISFLVLQIQTKPKLRIHPTPSFISSIRRTSQRSLPLHSVHRPFFRERKFLLLLKS